MSSTGPRQHRDPSALELGYAVLVRVERDGAFAQLALEQVLREAGSPRSSAEATELAYGTCRMLGTHDAIIELASRRSVLDLQPEVQQILRLTSHRLLAMRTPSHAAVSTAVELAKQRVGHRVGGLVNAISRRIAERDLDFWLAKISENADELERLAITHHHPVWIAELYRDLLGDQAGAAMDANNVPVRPTYVVRPGLAERNQFADPDHQTSLSPFGFTSDGRPGDLAAIKDGRAGVQDEGSQLVAWLLSKAKPPTGDWLDLCAGPGGKAALLTGLARQKGAFLLANEIAPHRAELVRRGLRAYPDGWQVICADGTVPAWSPNSFAAVMADVPCTGLGALRRRPDARWRKQPDEVAQLTELQLKLARSAADALVSGGVMAYVTCSPHPAETTDIVHALLAERNDLDLLDAPEVLPGLSDAASTGDPKCIQLWPHRHHTDAMFAALLRRR